MTKRRSSGIGIAAGLALLASGTTAHHNSGAVFDLEREIVIEGIVTRYEWRNPHVYIHIDGAPKGTAPAPWRIEAGPRPRVCGPALRPRELSQLPRRLTRR